MNKKLFVGNLSYSLTDDALKNLFSQFGTVISASVVMDKFSGRSKGFGFVEMSTDEEAEKAIKGLNETEVEGRKIFVSEAKPREDKPRGDFNRGGFSGDRRGGFDRGRRDSGNRY